MTKQFKIKKILNNNAAIARDGKQEVILSAKGLGYQYRQEKWLTEFPGLKVYYLDSRQTKNRFEMLFDEIPYEYIKLTQQVIEDAEKALNQPLNQLLLITLADHIHFAVKRYRDGTANYGMQNEEIRRFFPKEYQIAETAVDEINKQYSVELAAVEPTMIAFHIVNAEYANQNQDSKQIVKALEDILAIVEQELHMKLSPDSPDYSRLVIHLKFFLKGVFSNKAHDPDQFENLSLNLNNQQSAAANRCVTQIADYLMTSYHYQMSGDERFYLIIHMIRIMG